LANTQKKRGLSGWHDRGNLPFNVITTPFGEIATIICSDSYLPDWLRIVALKGADIILLPANWWGSYGQEEIWQTRARENGVWVFTANRWGVEIDERWGWPYTYYMNDAPSAVITPDGSIQLIHKAEDDTVPADRILYYTVRIPKYRIGNSLNPVYSINFRRPEAYSEIANLYYRPDLGNQPAPNLPPGGTTNVASISYTPKPFSPSDNLAEIDRIYHNYGSGADIIVLPGLGITSAWVNSSDPNWFTATHWSQLQGFIEYNELTLAITTLLEYDWSSHCLYHALLVVRPGKPPLLHRQTHNSLFTKGTGAKPLIIEISNARLGLLTGRDALFPEIATHLVKSGIDILLVSSMVGVATTSHHTNSPNYFWDVEALHRLWKTRTNHVFHLVASDWTGNGAVIESTWGVIGRYEIVDAANPIKVLDLNSNSVRSKYLNAYYSFDLDSLLGN
jgi:predicted amidohydrolase